MCDNLLMAIPAKNIAYLLWKKEVPHSEWIQTLAIVLDWSEERAWALLEGRVATLDPERLSKLASWGGVKPGEPLTEGFLDGKLSDILKENLAFLMDQLKHGEKKELAEKLKVNPTTISRWAKGTQLPTRKKVQELLAWFGLPPQTDLRVEPVFLWSPTALPTGRRSWLHHQIDTLDDDSLQRLFPALTKLLMER